MVGEVRRVEVAEEAEAVEDSRSVVISYKGIVDSVQTALTLTTYRRTQTSLAND